MSDQLPPSTADRRPGLAGVGIVILAAGASTRLGRPKQLLRLDGRTVLQHVVDAAEAVQPDRVVVVVGYAGREIEASLAPGHHTIVHNPAASRGQSTSLAAGLGALDEHIGRAVILLGDQPRIDPDVIRRVAVGDGPIRRARYRDRPGHPVAFDAALWPELIMIAGDRGARDLLRQTVHPIHEASVDADAPLDLDTDADARALGVADTPPDRH